MITPPEYKRLHRLILAKEMAEFSRKFWGMYNYQRKRGWLKESDHLPIGVSEYPEIKCTIVELLNMA